MYIMIQKGTLKGADQQHVRLYYYVSSFSPESKTNVFDSPCQSIKYSSDYYPVRLSLTSSKFFVISFFFLRSSALIFKKDIYKKEMLMVLFCFFQEKELDECFVSMYTTQR